MFLYSVPTCHRVVQLVRPAFRSRRPTIAFGVAVAVADRLTPFALQPTRQPDGISCSVTSRAGAPGAEVFAITESHLGLSASVALT
jgi:hypothetical protein